MSRAEDQCPECGEQRIQGICWRCKPMEKTAREEELEAALLQADADRDAEVEAAVRSWTHSVEELEAKLKEREQQLGNLLARIHRDGGHHLNDVGYEQACLDADDEWANFTHSVAELEATIQSRDRQLSVLTDLGKEVYRICERDTDLFNAFKEALNAVEVWE